MPYMSNGKRDYKKEEALYEKKHPERNKARVARNKARAMVKKTAGAAAIKGKDIGHSKAISKGGKSVLANLFIQSPATNRSFSRKADGSMKSERSKRESGKKG